MCRTKFSIRRRDWRASITLPSKISLRLRLWIRWRLRTGWPAGRRGPTRGSSCGRWIKHLTWHLRRATHKLSRARKSTIWSEARRARCWRRSQPSPFGPPGALPRAALPRSVLPRSVWHCWSATLFLLPRSGLVHRVLELPLACMRGRGRQTGVRVLRPRASAKCLALLVGTAGCFSEVSGPAGLALLVFRCWSSTSTDATRKAVCGRRLDRFAADEVGVGFAFADDAPLGAFDEHFRDPGAGVVV